jgi:hypothetical protein
MTPSPKRLFLFTLMLFALAATAPAALAQQSEAGKDEEPTYKDYKGVRIGMTADEARKKLGDPTDKGDKQDFYIFSDDETAQIFYDAEKKVSAIAVVYTGGASVPTGRAVFGKDVAPKPDGTQYLRVTYPKVGYWVSYSRTGGDTPIISVTMQKKQ